MAGPDCHTLSQFCPTPIELGKCFKNIQTFCIEPLLVFSSTSMKLFSKNFENVWEIWILAIFQSTAKCPPPLAVTFSKE